MTTVRHAAPGNHPAHAGSDVQRYRRAGGPTLRGGGPSGPGPFGPGTVFKGAPGASLPVDTPPVTAPLSHRVRTFRDQGDMDSAVALVRAETGMARAEAERFIAALD